MRDRNLNSSIAFITHPYFKLLKEVRLISTHYFLMKIRGKKELLQIAINHL